MEIISTDILNEVRNGERIYFSSDNNEEFVLISRKELNNMAGLKRLITPTDDFSSDELYSTIADIPDDRSFSDKETGLLDPAVRQFRASCPVM